VKRAIGLRDEEYIDNRLTAPASDALDAAGRLRQCGQADLADRVIEAVATLTDTCREIRQELRSR